MKVTIQTLKVDGAPHSLDIKVTDFNKNVTVMDIQREVNTTIVQWTEGCFADINS